jgi:3-methyl-2-oxobutanoate hydroxymethyltransferase
LHSYALQSKFIAPFSKGSTMAQYLTTPDSNSTPRKAITIPSLFALRNQAEKITMLTCYDASFAAMMDRCGVEILLIGDSLGMVCQGHNSTLPVSIADMVYHTASVARGNQHALLVADMPFASYATPEQAYANAAQLIQAGAHMVKLEGGQWLLETVKFLTERSIPVCAHLGLTPQSVHQLGGYKVQGKTDAAAELLKAEALALQTAGASLLVLEAIPSALAKQVTDALAIPTIGIGAGPDCSGQVLVMHDLLGVFPGKKARFVKNFMEGQSSIEQAILAYVQEVKQISFPAPEHCFN